MYMCESTQKSTNDTGGINDTGVMLSSAAPVAVISTSGHMHNPMDGLLQRPVLKQKIGRPVELLGAVRSARGVQCKGYD